MFILFTQWKFRFISSVSVNAMMHIFWWHVCVCVCTFLLDMFLEVESLVVGCVWILLNSFPSGYSSLHSHQPCMGLPQWLSSKEFACSVGAAEEVGFIPGSRRSPGGGHGYSSILAWRMPWTEEPGGLRSIGSQRIGHSWSNLTCRQPRMRLTVAPIFSNVLTIIFILAILVGMQLYCIVILICISLITSEAEHHFVYYWPFEYFLFVKWLFQAFCLPPPFLNFLSFLCIYKYIYVFGVCLFCHMYTLQITSPVLVS